LRILVVEDDDRLVPLLQRGLGEEGHTVDACTCCADALGQAQTIAYDVILLDWMLPDGDGLALLRTWRDRGVDTPVLMLTARGAVGERVLGLRTGADDYLVKPFDFSELLARIEALVRRRDGEAARLRVGDVTLDSRKRALVPRGARGGADAPRARPVRAAVPPRGRGADALGAAGGGVGPELRRRAERARGVRRLRARQAGAARRGRAGGPGPARGRLPPGRCGPGGRAAVTLQRRLLLFGALLPAATVALVLFSIGLMMQRLLLQSVDRGLALQAASESVSLFDRPGQDAHLHFGDSALAGDLRRLNHQGALYGPGGARLVAFPADSAAPERLTAAEVGRVPALRTTTLASGERIRELSLAIDSPRGESHALWLAVSLAANDTALAAYARVAALIGAAATLGMLLLQVWHARGLASRIQRLHTHMQRLRDGDFAAAPAEDDGTT
jgi:CheY-like chemotaxis protein